MLRFLQRACLALAIAGAANSASAFSLLGPFAGDAAGTIWEAPAIGYNVPGFADIGGPQNLGEEYRWNVKTITYGFDPSFGISFGERAENDIRKMMDMLNSLPPFSKMSSNLTEFPQDVRRSNYRAGALGVLDMKSYALAFVLEEMGLASPERYTWTLRNSVTTAGVTYYTVIKRNFDPVTTEPSSYVNGTLYTYGIFSFTAPVYVDAVEIPVDPLDVRPKAVVTAADGAAFVGGLSSGDYFTGLTRDDIGCLRYLYRPSNYNIESLETNVTGSAGGSAWTPVGGGGSVVLTALRPGVDKIKFVEGKYDSQFGGFIGMTNQYKDTYVTNSHLVTQTIQRAVTLPDIVFAAADLGVNAYGYTFGVSRSDTTGWVNNDLLNGQSLLNGPGVIQPQVVITFNNVGPSIVNYSSPTLGDFLDEVNNGGYGVLWGSFDGTTNEPVLYPNGLSIQELERLVVSGH